MTVHFDAIFCLQAAIVKLFFSPSSWNANRALNIFKLATQSSSIFKVCIFAVSPWQTVNWSSINLFRNNLLFQSLSMCIKALFQKAWKLWDFEGRLFKKFILSAMLAFDLVRDWTIRFHRLGDLIFVWMQIHDPLLEETEALLQTWIFLPTGFFVGGWSPSASDCESVPLHSVSYGPIRRAAF